MNKELRTLKDLDLNDLLCYPNDDREVLEKRLKAEAVKWVKEFSYMTGRTSFGKNTCAGVCYGLIQFFNLTEEDLT